MNETRVRELIYINRVLAFLVVVLAIVAGMLIAMKEKLLVEKEKPAPVITPVPSASDSGMFTLPNPINPNNEIDKALGLITPIRTFDKELITSNEISQILWSAYGVNNNWGGHTVPSYKSLYLLKLRLVIRKSDKWPMGIYEYMPDGHRLELVSDLSNTQEEGAFVQPSAQTAPILLLISGETKLSTNTVAVEVGHIAQNVFLKAASLNLGAVEIFDMDQTRLRSAYKIPLKETVLLTIPIGKVLEE